MGQRIRATSGINYLGGLRREFHHVKAIRDGQEEYEPAMVLLREERKGRAFMIPLSCLWKYMEPRDNEDARALDHAEFDKMARTVYFKRQVSLSPATTSEDAAAIILAERFNDDSGLMLCTGFGLVKCCQILDITVCSQSMAQLLMFIQDGLDQLKNMPDHEAEESMSVGEAVISINGKQVHKEVVLTETDLTLGGM